MGVKEGNEGGREREWEGHRKRERMKNCEWSTESSRLGVARNAFPVLCPCGGSGS